MSDYIYRKVSHLVSRWHTRDPFELLDCLHVVVSRSDRFHQLKGFCLISCRTAYVVINSSLSAEEQRLVAAHELGHIVLHRRQLSLAPMQDSQLYDMTSHTEYEANLFAADLLLSDQDVESCSDDPELDYFSLCRLLSVSPDLMSFKLFSLVKRGHPVNMPLELNSRFLKKTGSDSDRLS